MPCPIPRFEPVTTIVKGDDMAFEIKYEFIGK